MRERIITALAWTAALLSIAWVLTRAGGFDRGFPAIALMALTPYAAILVALAAVAAFLLGRRTPALVTGLCALALIAQVAPRAISDSPPDPRPRGPEVRVLGANLLKGRASVRPLAELAASRDLDALGLAELTPQAARRISRSPIAKQLPHAILEPRPGSLGAGLLSRYPLRRLPVAAADGQAQRIAALAHLPAGVTAELHSIHPYPPSDAGGAAQLGPYLSAIPPADPSGTPRLLVGDFNATLDNGDLRDLLDSGYVDAADSRGGGLTPTWPAHQALPPPVTIDHVLVDRRVEVLDYSVEDLPGSDHRAVYAALRLPAVTPRR